MQTFMTHSSFNKTAWSLDSLRLNKQLLECRQIIAANLGLSKGWTQHPATLMWKGYEYGLGSYAFSMAEELAYRNIAWEKNMNAIADMLDNVKDTGFPPWLFNSVQRDRVLTTHRASLYRKNPEHYKQFEIDNRYWHSQVCCQNTKRVCQTYWPSHEFDT